MARQEFHHKKMTAWVYSIKNGVKEIQNVRLIRIKSKQYNLLVMEDYLPVLGEIEGDLTIQSDEETFRLEDIYGFYIHQNNLFRLMLKEKREEI